MAPRFLARILHCIRCPENNSSRTNGGATLKRDLLQQAVIAIAFLLSAGVAQALPLTLVSHAGSATSSAFAPPGTLNSESDTAASATDLAVQTSASSTVNVSGTGSGGSGPGTGPGGPGIGGGDPLPDPDPSIEFASANTNDTMSTSTGTNKFSFSHEAIFSTDGVNPGGNASAVMNAVWVMALNAASVDLTYSVSAQMIGTANSGSMLMVRNMTTNVTILSLTDPAAIGSTVLNLAGSIGDIIQIDVTGQSSFLLFPNSSSVINSTSYSLEFAENLATIPEAGALLLLGAGLAGLVLAGRRQRR